MQKTTFSVDGYQNHRNYRIPTALEMRITDIVSTYGGECGDFSADVVINRSKSKCEILYKWSMKLMEKGNGIKSDIDSKKGELPAAFYGEAMDSMSRYMTQVEHNQREIKKKMGIDNGS